MDYTLGEPLFFKKAHRIIKKWLISHQENGFRPVLLTSKTLVAFAAFLFIVKILFILAFLPFPKNFFFADITRLDVTSLLNENRTKDGLLPLYENQKLDQAALLKAQDMVAKNYFAHESPGGISPWFWFSEVGYRYSYAGENLAVGFIGPKELYDAWLNSPDHRRNILNPNYTEMGSAVVQGFGQNNAMLVVQLFGTPIKSLPVATVAPKPPVVENRNEAIITPLPVVERPGETAIAPDSPREEDATPTVPVVVQNNGQVLAESTDQTGKKSTYFYGQILHVIFYNQKVVQYAFYILLMVMAIPLIHWSLNGLNNIDKATVFRVAAILMLIGVSLWIDMDKIYQVIPHQIII